MKRFVQWFHLGDLGIWTKHTNYEQANRIPLLITVPGITKSNTVTRQLAESVDIFPTLAEAAGLPAPVGPQVIDGVSLAGLLRGEDLPTSPRKNYYYYQSGDLSGVREGKWKYIACPGSGGWGKPKTKDAAKEAKTKGLPLMQLYDMEQDLGEQNNLAASKPETAERLRKLLDTQIEKGRTTPGPAQKNDMPVVVEKWAKK